MALQTGEERLFTRAARRSTWERLGRWALVTDRPLDNRMCSRLGVTRTNGALAVLVDSRYYLHARALVPNGVRCVTHPDELRVLQLDACVVWGQFDVLDARAEVLRTFADVHWVDDSRTVPSLYRRQQPSRCDGVMAHSI